ncbi:hypothetical protein [Nonomuraea sp. NPDC049709]|uniref:hypothetical protein n=1 Tax=Nonomuraea sp. NPDC049709 TaxID=3154736 RepID=UPI00341ACDBF
MDKLHADKPYDHKQLRAKVRRRGITVRIARKNVESSQRLGRHRWVIGRTIEQKGSAAADTSPLGRPVRPGS